MCQFAGAPLADASDGVVLQRSETQTGRQLHNRSVSESTPGNVSVGARCSGSSSSGTCSSMNTYKTNATCKKRIRNVDPT
eukprot:2643205-Pyramimonas_sp.AAC.1